jgi:hypothetical protein
MQAPDQDWDRPECHKCQYSSCQLRAPLFSTTCPSATFPSLSSLCSTKREGVTELLSAPFGKGIDRPVWSLICIVTSDQCIVSNV